MKQQLTLRGMVIGGIGCVILTTSSMYVALRLGALPWPIIFVALVSMFSLKCFGNTNMNEINVTHTAMSAGSMVAGGLAFTIPGIWMADSTAEVNPWILLLVTLGGVLLGIVFTGLLRKYFVVTQALPYPMGIAAAETLRAGDQGGKKALTLFSSMGFAGVFTLLRDWFAWIPTMFFGNVAIPGVTFGLWASPMMVSVGYIVGPLFILTWFLGALIGDFGVVVGGTQLGLWDLATAADIKASLGIGVMVGTGVGIIVKGILPKAKEIFVPMFSKEQQDREMVSFRWAPLLIAVLAFLFAYVADMGLVASIVTIVGVWLATAMSAQIVGQSGINPMEIFGVIVLLAVKVVSSIGQLEAFFVAAIVAVACGLVGDVMNDFKAGHSMGTNPKAQWWGEAIGGVLGAFVAVGVLFVLVQAYGTEAFGTEQFPAPQAGVVKAMVAGIPHIPAFWIGLLAGLVLYVCNLPVMTLGLGIYLPFYLSFTAAIGGFVHLLLSKCFPKWSKTDNALILSSGLLGGEAVVGVLLALVQIVMSTMMRG